LTLLSAAAAATPPTPASISRLFIIVTFSCSILLSCFVV